MSVQTTHTGVRMCVSTSLGAISAPALSEKPRMRTALAATVSIPQHRLGQVRRNGKFSKKCTKVLKNNVAATWHNDTVTKF